MGVFSSKVGGMDLYQAMMQVHYSHWYGITAIKLREVGSIAAL